MAVSVIIKLKSDRYCISVIISKLGRPAKLKTTLAAWFKIIASVGATKSAQIVFVKLALVAPIKETPSTQVFWLNEPELRASRKSRGPPPTEPAGT